MNRLPSKCDCPGRARGLLALGLLLLATGVAADPPLWEMTLDRSTVRIAGSIHYLREGDYPLPEVLRAAYERAGTLVVEYDTRQQGQPVNPMVLTRRVPRAGRLDPPGPLRRFLSIREFTALRRLARERGYDVDRLDDMKPWFAGMYVMERELGESGFRSDLGLDNRLLELAHEDDKRVISLESEADQRRLFGGISIEEQVDFLAEALEDAPRMAPAMARVVDTWKRGDLKALEETLLRNLKRRPGEYRRFSVDRNRNWVEKLAALPDDRGDYLVVVGVVHLLGDASLIVMLRERGFHLRRVEGAGDLAGASGVQGR